MSYREVTMYIAVCNRCGDECEDDEYAAWATREQADSVARSADWTTDGDRHWCPRCGIGRRDPIREQHAWPGPADQMLPLDEQADQADDKVVDGAMDGVAS